MTSSYRDKDFGQSVVLKKNNKFRLSGGVIDAPDKRLPFFHGSPILIYNRTGLIKNTLNSTGVRNNYGAQLDYANVIFWELYCFRYYRVASWRQLGEGEGGMASESLTFDLLCRRLDPDLALLQVLGLLEEQVYGFGGLRIVRGVRPEDAAKEVLSR